MKPRTVFIAAATADYPAARSVLQSLTEHGRRCFFCDEALLRAGEAGYLTKVDEALEEAGALVVVAGSRERANAEWVRFAWRRFGETPERRTVTALCDGVTAKELPRSLRRGDCLTFPQELDSLDRMLFPQPGEPAPARRAKHAGARRSVRLVAVMTVCNVLILGSVVWLLVSNSGHLFPSRPPGAGEGATFPGKASGTFGSPGKPPGRLSSASEKAPSSAGAQDASLSGDALVSTLMNGRLLRDAGEAISVQLDGNPAPGTAFQISLRGDVQETFSFIPAGSFIMGSPPDEVARGDDESQRRVEITQGFWLARGECTIGLWRSVMGTVPEAANDGEWFPVHTASWDQVTGAEVSFIARMNGLSVVPAGWRFTLPTEEQWEFACRAGTATPFSFGRVLDGTQANCDGNLPYGTKTPGPWLARTAEVGSYSPNAWGLFDMHGNVWEWCANRIRRGGGWRFGAAHCRSASREPGGEYGDDMLGFRLAIVREE